MGGGDLNMKKSWHPLLRKNQERVWLEEKKALAEKKKTDQLKKELEEERQLQELQRLQEEQTGKKRSEKMDWMYATPAAGSGTNPNDLEDYLLGKKRVDQILIGNENEKVGASHKSFIAVQNANNARDTAAKVREDPLFAIKQQEQAALQSLMSNPLRLKALKEKVGVKEGKKHKKDKKKDKHRGRDYEDDRRHRSNSRSVSPPRRRYEDRRSRSPPRSRDDRYDDYSSRDRYRRDRSRERLPRDDDRDSRRRDDRNPPRRREEDSDNSHRSQPPPYRRSPRNDDSQRSTTLSSSSSKPYDAAAERAARLAQMTANASEMETNRQTRFEEREAKLKEELELEEEARRKAGKGAKGGFMAAQEKAVFGVTNSMDLEERISRNRGRLVREID